jgi:molybdenum cofactor cytidylyltransferase
VPDVGGIILAAGASRRMGDNKMLRTIDGETLVHRAVRRAAEAGLSPLITVVGRDAGLVRAAVADLACDVIPNPAFEGPTSGSLHLGLQALPGDVGAAVVILADMVMVTAAMLHAVAEGARRGDTPLVVSRYGGVLAPPLVFRRRLFPELLARHGEGCGKQVALRHHADATFIDWPEAAIFDVDSPEDFATLLTL